MAKDKQYYIAVHPSKKTLYAAELGVSGDWGLFHKEGKDPAVATKSYPEYLLCDSESECNLAIDQIYAWAGRRTLHR